jgi:hypothetical protein
MKKWFTHDSDGVFRTHDTEDEAHAFAQGEIEGCREIAGDSGWPEGTSWVCWGQIRECARQNVVHAHDDSCRNADGVAVCGHSTAFDEIWEYDLQAVGGSEPEPERAKTFAERLAKITAAVIDLDVWQGGPRADADGLVTEVYRPIKPIEGLSRITLVFHEGDQRDPDVEDTTKTYVSLAYTLRLQTKIVIYENRPRDIERLRNYLHRLGGGAEIKGRG